MDQLLATGEQVTIALIAMALAAQGHEAISFTGGQIGLITDENFSKARVKELDKQKIMARTGEGQDCDCGGVSGGDAGRAILRRWGGGEQCDAGGDRGGAEGGCVRELHGCGGDFYGGSADGEGCAADQGNQLR